MRKNHCDETARGQARIDFPIRPRHVVTKLNDVVVKTFGDPAVIKRLTELGQSIPPREQMTPEALAAFHKGEIEKWWPLIKGANIKVE